MAELDRVRGRDINRAETPDERLEEVLGDQDRQSWKEVNRAARKSCQRFR